jgi:hypothetical protein
MKTIEAGIRPDTNPVVLNKYRAINYLQEFNNHTKVSDLYDDNSHFRTIMNDFIEGFEYPDWSHRRVCDIINAIEKS